MRAWTGLQCTFPSVRLGDADADLVAVDAENGDDGVLVDDEFFAGASGRYEHGRLPQGCASDGALIRYSPETPINVSGG